MKKIRKRKKSEFNLKYTLPSLIITYIILFLGTAGINTAIRSLFNYFNRSSIISGVVIWGVTILALIHFMYVVLVDFGIIHKTDKIWKNKGVK